MKCVAVVCASLVLAGIDACAADPAPVLGRSLEAFSAPDARGRVWTQHDFAEAPVLVVAFLGTECPLAKLYGPRLQAIANDYADRDVRVIGIDANRQDALSDLAAYVKQHGIEFPLVKDLNNVLADRLGAERTPEAFVLDRERKVAYHGRIDDQYAIGGRSRPQPSQQELRAAIDDVLANRSVAIAETQAIGCLIGRVRTPSSDAEVTYSKHIAPLLAQRCVDCHRPGEIGPFSLTEYSEVVGWADMIAEVTEQGRMPPWHANPEFGHFANENRLTDAERKLIRDWVSGGAPEGNRADLPPPRTYTAGWQFDREPDRVVAMRDRPFNIPPEGEVRYQYFSVDPGFKEDVWVNAAEVVPGNRAVVHHVIVFATGSDNKLVDDDRQMLTAYVPGLRVTPLPQGMAKRIPAGSRLIFQLHYTPNGTPATDLTKIGLYFVNEKDVTHQVQTISTRTRQFKIEPHLDDQRFKSSPVIAPRDVLLLSMSPHMHLRGKSFRYDITWPGGKTETLLDVPNYDFNWQTAYRLSEPLSIPRGSKLLAYASFDNSEKNLANPDPSATVVWGDQSWEEMMIGYADVAIERTGDPVSLAQELRRSSLPDMATRMFKSLDKNGDGKLERTELDERWRERFDRVDTNKDGIVTPEELERGVDFARRLLGQ